MSLVNKTAVIEFGLNPKNASRSRTKAMQLAATVSHVESITLKGENMDLLVIHGKEIDVIVITVLLKKRPGAAKLIDYAPTPTEEDSQTVKETFTRVLYHPEDHPDRPDPRNNSYGCPGHYNSQNRHRETYGTPNVYTDPYNYGYQYPAWHYYDQRLANRKTYPVDQIEYVSYRDN